MFISPQFLKPQANHLRHQAQLPNSFPVVIIYQSEGAEWKHISFTLEKNLVDLIARSLEGTPANRSVVDPFVIAMKGQATTLPALDLSHRTHMTDDLRWEFHLKDDLFYFIDVDKDKGKDNGQRCRFSGRRKRMKPILVECPCHKSTACEYKDVCGICDSSPGPSEPDESKENHSLAAEDFPMDMLCRPDDIVFSIPFATNGSIVPQAAFHLNEVNITKNHGKIVAEEAIMSRMGLYFTHLTNRDVYSLYPNNNITHNVIDMWTSW
jgi:hypothetical protein